MSVRSETLQMIYKRIDIYALIIEGTQHLLEKLKSRGGMGQKSLNRVQEYTKGYLNSFDMNKTKDMLPMFASTNRELNMELEDTREFMSIFSTQLKASAHLSQTIRKSFDKDQNLIMRNNKSSFPFC